MDVELLKSLYWIQSFSGEEQNMFNFITSWLDDNQIKYYTKNRNILYLGHKDKPILSAHIDQVKTTGFVKGDYLHSFSIVEGIITGRTKDNKQIALGADDKNGIFVILSLLKAGAEFNFILTHGEESGFVGIREVLTTKNRKRIKQCSYAICLDRMNKDNIIGYGNDYCLALDYQIERFSNSVHLPYRCASGILCDADYIKECIEVVNLSVGYYKHHTDSEYTVLSELERTIDFVGILIECLDYKSVPANRIDALDSWGKSYGWNKGSTWRGSNYNKYKKEEEEPWQSYGTYGIKEKPLHEVYGSIYDDMVREDEPITDYPFPQCEGRIADFSCHKCEHYDTCDIAEWNEYCLEEQAKQLENKQYDEMIEEAEKVF